MKGILINGSPKRRDSSSGALLDDLRSLLDPGTETAVMTVTASLVRLLGHALGAIPRGCKTA